MQFIDIAISSLTLASVSFFTIQFVAGLMKRHRVSPGQLSLLNEQLQPIWDECATDDGQWLAEIQPIAIPEGIFSCDAAPDDAGLVEAYIQSRKLQTIDRVGQRFVFFCITAGLKLLRDKSSSDRILGGV